jgi:AcrR family transcriptional regulator
MSRPADPHAKEALIAAARAEFARRGLRGARIEDITAACGLSKGAFYLHFESKEGLFKVLVDAFLAEMGECATARLADAQSFWEENGALAPQELRAQSTRLQAFLEQECKEDLHTLEVMWRYRDVLDVLISGCQGTTFEGTLWEVIELEQVRVAETNRKFQQLGLCRADVPPELFGALVIGTYLLVGKKMAKAAEKPDLALWARTLQLLIREGSVPRDEVPRAPAPSAESLRRKALAKKKIRSKTAPSRSAR